MQLTLQSNTRPVAAFVAIILGIIFIVVAGNTRAEETADRVDCLRQLWAVSIDGRSVPLTSFQPAERGDLRMRGLIGLVPLAGLEPGLREIAVLWNPGAAEESRPLDDRYADLNTTYVIPIAFSPGIETSLD